MEFHDFSFLGQFNFLKLFNSSLVFTRTKGAKARLHWYAEEHKTDNNEQWLCTKVSC